MYWPFLKPRVSPSRWSLCSLWFCFPTCCARGFVLSWGSSSGLSLWENHPISLTTGGPCADPKAPTGGCLDWTRPRPWGPENHGDLCSAPGRTVTRAPQTPVSRGGAPRPVSISQKLKLIFWICTVFPPAPPRNITASQVGENLH